MTVKLTIADWETEKEIAKEKYKKAMMDVKIYGDIIQVCEFEIVKIKQNCGTKIK